MNKDYIYNNIIKINKKIKKHAIKAKRNPQDIKIVAVSKNKTIEQIFKAIQNGIYCFGENKVQEAETKFNKIKNKEIEKHFIGHLQTNKAKKAVSLFDFIQSVDSIKIAEKISKEAVKINKKQKIYLQINTGKDINKYGFTPENSIKNAIMIKDFPNIEIIGIMTIGKKNITEKKLFKLFEKTQQIKRKIEKKILKELELSMGMSNDYHIAIKAGATQVRIGTEIFGERRTK